MYDAAVGIVGNGATCVAPQFERPQKVCVKGGEPAVAYVPKLGETNPAGPPRRSGCSGSCALGDGSGPATGVFAASALALAAALRRRTRKVS